MIDVIRANPKGQDLLSAGEGERDFVRARFKNRAGTLLRVRTGFLSL